MGNPSEALFLVSPANEAFVSGRSPMPQNENPTLGLVYRILGTLLGVAFFGYWLYKALTKVESFYPPKPIWPVVMAACLTAWIIFVVCTTLGPIFWNRRFRQPCRLLFGELVSCNEREDDTDTRYWDLKYRFASPSGRVLEGKWSTGTTATQVGRRATPQPGMRVAIAYISDRVHRVV